MIYERLASRQSPLFLQWYSNSENQKRDSRLFCYCRDGQPSQIPIVRSRLVPSRIYYLRQVLVLTMKALYSGLTTDLSTKYMLNVLERPTPVTPEDGVLVKVLASGINPSDGGNALVNIFNRKKPIIPGRDYAGIVHDSRSSSFPIGTPVFGTSGNVFSFTADGGAAEYIAVPDNAVVRKPECLSFTQAGVVGVPYTTALEALESGRVAKGKDSVLILGASGAVGRAATSICRSWKCTVVTASRGDTTDVNIANSQLERVKEILGGKGPDVIIDAVGSAELMEAGMKILAWGGRYVVITAGKGGALEARLDMRSLYRQAHSIFGINSVEQTPEQAARRLARLSEMFEKDGLDAPDEQSLVKITIEDSPEAYAQAFKFTGKRHVIVFD